MADSLQEMASLVRCADYDEETVACALDEAIGAVGGLDWVKPGMRIAVKPNLLMKKPPDAACTTHPTLLAVLVDRLVARGAHVVVGDSPGGPFTVGMLKGVYDGCGLTSLESRGAVLNRDVETVKCAYPEGVQIRQLEICRFIAEADAVIDVAKLKTHGMMNYTGAVKNLFGAIPGTMKVEYHYRMPTPQDFAAMLVDIASYIRPRLSIIDAVWAMEGEGPAHGKPRKIGAIVASTSPAWADAVGTALIDMPEAEAPTQVEARKRGLLDGFSLDNVAGVSVSDLCVSDFSRISGFVPNHAFLFRSDNAVTKVLRKPLEKMLTPIPRLDDADCVGCGECARACPPKAIAMRDTAHGKRPDIDRDTCIRCFCCQELCPKAAIHIHRPWLARRFQRS